MMAIGVNITRLPLCVTVRFVTMPYSIGMPGSDDLSCSHSLRPAQMSNQKTNSQNKVLETKIECGNQRIKTMPRDCDQTFYHRHILFIIWCHQTWYDANQMKFSCSGTEEHRDHENPTCSINDMKWFAKQKSLERNNVVGTIDMDAQTESNFHCA
jgi:hypothetical protein